MAPELNYLHLDLDISQTQPRLSEDDLLFHPHWSRCPKCNQVVSSLERGAHYYNKEGEYQYVPYWIDDYCITRGKGKSHYLENDEFCRPYEDLPKPPSLLIRLLKWIMR